jgi:hypothetical protein
MRLPETRNFSPDWLPWPSNSIDLDTPDAARLTNVSIYVRGVSKTPA